VLSVLDRGPGIPRAMQQRIFEPFVRLDEGRARSQGGTGLGLAIAREIARVHGGDLTYQDRPSGGAVFIAVMRDEPPSSKG
jgi:signal transduction histidine kinase